MGPHARRAGSRRAPDGSGVAAPTTSPTCESAPAAGELARGARTGPPTRMPCPAGSPVSTAVATRPSSATDADRHVVIAMRARELGRKGIVVGDDVYLVGDTTGADGSLARIVRVAPREHGAAPHRRRHRPGRAGARGQRRPARRRLRPGQPRAAPPADRPLPGRRLRRRHGAPARADQGRPHRPGALPRAVRRAVGAAPSSRRGTTAPPTASTPCARRSPGGSACSSATPGVGKSTLVNALVPLALRATGVVNDVTGRGRHTSSSAVALALPDDDGWVIDTPGIRSFGLAHVDLGPDHPALPRPRARHRAVPPRLHPRRGGVRPRRLGRQRCRRAGRRRRGWTRCAACCGPAPPTTGD